jgi:threonine synthase
LNYYSPLEYSYSNEKHDAEIVQTVCKKCGNPLFARYDLDKIKKNMTRRELRVRRAKMWKYGELLQFKERRNGVSLGESWTPLLYVKKLDEISISGLYVARACAL